MDDERMDDGTDDAPPPPPPRSPEDALDDSGEAGEPIEPVTADDAADEPTASMESVVESPEPEAETDATAVIAASESLLGETSTRVEETDSEPMPDDEPEDERTGMRRGSKIAIVLTSVIAVLGIAYASVAWYVQDKIPSNTFVDGIPVGGLSADEAVTKLDDEFGARPAQPVFVSVEDRTVELAAEEVGIAVDTDKTVEPLVAFSLDPRVLWSHITGLGDVDPVIEIDSDSAQAALVSVLPSLELEPVEGSIVFEDGEADVTEAVVGIRVNVPDSIEKIHEEWFSSDEAIAMVTVTDEPEITQDAVDEAMAEIVEPLLSAPVTVREGETSGDLEPEQLASAATISPNSGALSLSMDGDYLYEALLDVNDDFTHEGENARIVIQNGSPAIIPSKNGATIDHEQLADVVAAAALESDEREAVVESVSEKPEFTTEDAEELGVSEAIAEFSTPLTADNVRTQNLIVGAEKITDTLVLPGEEFSLLAALGPITAERGFVSSGVVSNGFTSNAVGGGLSQLSTTAYNAAYFAGFEILQHQPHSRWFSRYPEGRESTLWDPGIDMRFRNNTPYGALVQSWVSGGETHVRIWSTDHFEVESHTGARTNIRQPSVRYNDSSECIAESGGQVGFSVSGYRKVFLDGEEVDHWSWSWTYEPWHVVRCGTQSEWESRNSSSSDD